MIFGNVDFLGGELAHVVQQFTIFLLKAFVARIWLDFTILDQTLKEDHASYVG